jgi:hypothetical protein
MPIGQGYDLDPTDRLGGRRSGEHNVSDPLPAMPSSGIHSHIDIDDASAGPGRP